MQGGDFRVHRFEGSAGEHRFDLQSLRNAQNLHLCGKQQSEAILMASTLHGANSGNFPALHGVDGPRVLQSTHLPTSATVLLVEDNAMVRECLRELLGDIGGRVSDAASAAEAMERIAAEGVPDVLVTDLQLGPGPNGLALIAAARRRWPGVRAVLISGTNVEEPALDPGDRFLRKPFKVEILVRAVSELVARQDGP